MTRMSNAVPVMALLSITKFMVLSTVYSDRRARRSYRTTGQLESLESIELTAAITSRTTQFRVGKSKDEDGSGTIPAADASS